MEKLIKKIKDFSELVMFQHSVFALPFIFIAMVVSSSQINQTPWFGFKLLVLGTLCAVLHEILQWVSTVLWIEI